MPFPNKKLKVFPNPWGYIDHLGRPAGRLPLDGYEHSPGFGFVGAEFADVKLLQKAGLMRVAGQDMEVTLPLHDHRVAYSASAVSIPNTAYYRDSVKRGDLVAADKETASECGVKFEDSSSVLAKLKAEAVKRFDAETAPDAYSRFGSVEPLFLDQAPVNAQPQAAQSADKAAK